MRLALPIFRGALLLLVVCLERALLPLRILTNADRVAQVSLAACLLLRVTKGALEAQVHLRPARLAYQIDWVHHVLVSQ